MKADISSLKKAHVGAEYLPPSLRSSLRDRGIRVSQTYASADLGLIAYESVMPDGTVNEGMILDERLILEIVRPGTGDPVARARSGSRDHDLQQGLPSSASPPATFRRSCPARAPAGTNVRIKGWMGRADQSTKVRAMFVTPRQVNDIVRHPGIVRARLVVEGEAGDDRMTLKCEMRERLQGIAEAIVASIREVTKLRGDVQLVEPGSLPMTAR